MIHEEKTKGRVFPQISKLVLKTRLRLVFSTHFSLFDMWWNTLPRVWYTTSTLLFSISPKQEKDSEKLSYRFHKTSFLCCKLALHPLWSGTSSHCNCLVASDIPIFLNLGLCSPPSCRTQSWRLLVCLRQLETQKLTLDSFCGKRWWRFLPRLGSPRLSRWQPLELHPMRSSLLCKKSLLRAADFCV